MKNGIAASVALALFVAGVGVGVAAQKRIGAEAYRGQTPRQAADALLDTARVLAESDSWEHIAIGRIYYLGGDKAKGQAIFDGILADDHEDSDEFRIARVYREAGDWDKAKGMFDRYFLRNPKHTTEMATVGAYYLLQGDRAGAEQLFDRAFASKPEVWASIAAGGAYLGVAPQE